MKKLKFCFSRLIAFISPSLWRKIYCKPSHWEDRAAQERLFRYVRSGVNVRLRRSDSLSVSDLKRANELQKFAEQVSDYRGPYSRPMAFDENF